MKRAARRSGYRGRGKQDGAVLYVALIMLILLALIGIVGMRVASMQERMSANFQASNLAFQSAEEHLRLVECSVEALVNRSGPPACNLVDAGNVEYNCDDGYDPVSWANGLNLARETGPAEAQRTRLIGPCISGNSSTDMGAPVSEDPNPVYQITAYHVNDSNNPTSAAVVDTIFRP